MELVGLQVPAPKIPKKELLYHRCQCLIRRFCLSGLESHQFGDKHFQLQCGSGGEGAEAIQAVQEGQKKWSKATVAVACKIDFGLSDIER